MLPNYVIAGVMKCGTSALVRGVANHDRVFRAEGKELHYFDRYYEQGIGWYETRFDDRGDAIAFGEATPYLGHQLAVDRMVADLPETRFIVILRQPADRAYSHYWHNIRREREDLSFPEALDAEDARRTPDNTLFDYRNLGFYSRQLVDLTSRAGSDRVHVLLNEDFRDNRAGALRTIWEFLDVDPDAGRIEIPERSTRRQVIRNFKNFVKRRNDDRSYPPMDRKLRDGLTKEYADEINDLQDFLGRDLSSWLKMRSRAS